MKFFCWYFIYLSLSSGFKNIGGTKMLVENPGFDNPKAWQTESLPCAQQTIEFPINYEAVLPLPQEVTVGGFILPLNGAILLHENGLIDFDHNNQSKQECQLDKAVLKTPVTRSWYNPKDWRDFPKKSIVNSAVPDLDRIPCDNETVIINSNGPFTIDLENVQFLRLGQLYLTGTLITKEYLNYLLTTELGSVLFKNSGHVTVEYYRNEVCGCHIDSSYLAMPICQNLKSECAIPYCQDPIIPFGSCCAICGAVLNYEIIKCKREVLGNARKLLAKKLKELQLLNELDIDLNFYNNKNYGGLYMQIVAVDKNVYNERSVQFLQYVSAAADWKQLFNNTQLIREVYAGRYYNPHITLFSICLIIFCILLVLFVTLIIFAHYQPNHRVLQVMPTWMYDVRRWSVFSMRPPIQFARFDPHNERLVSRKEDVDENLSLKSDTTSIGHLEDNEAMSSFENPMCETGCDNLVVDESKSKENMPPLLETGSFVDINVNEKIEDLDNLEEIKLDTVSSTPK